MELVGGIQSNVEMMAFDELTKLIINHKFLTGGER